jgi:xanthine dehydrogenase accessory factor
MEDNDVKTVFISEERHIFGNRQGVASKWMGVALKADQSGLTKYQGTSLFTHHFKPHPRLFIFVGGPDVQPLARMADMAGFAVNVWDWRPDMLKQHFFPDVQLLEGAITGIIPAFNFRPTDAAIIMTHDFQKDKEILNLMLAQKHIGYLGVLGPRKRTTRLLANGAIPDHLHSPVGFKIGAEGPEEIAISIIAELIQTKRVAEKAVGGTRLREAKANES